MKPSGELRDFYQILDACNAASGAGRELLERELWTRFGVERTVLILDMAGFTARVRRMGLLYSLRKIRYMQTVVAPLLAEWGGELVKFEADNGFAIFTESPPAVTCGLAIHETLARLRDGSPDVDDVKVGIGLARGRILLVPGCDLFGDAVNFASKLGEDLAQAEELWADLTVAEAVKDDPGLRLERVPFQASGLNLEAVRIVRIMPLP